MSEPLKIALAGLGTVGAGLVKLLASQAGLLEARCGRRLVVTAVAARDRHKQRDIDISKFAWFDDPVEMAKSAEADVVVELIGGADGPAKALAEAAFAKKRHVVTANKAMLAHHGAALAAAAERAGVTMGYEAAVAGGIPIVKALREGLAGNKIQRVYGILNGTCNYILTRMELEKLSFADCLKDAQRLGYAEADPTFDVEGFDTAQKLAILASLAFGTKVEADAVYVEGISSITPADLEAADELGYRVKLLGVAVRTAQGIEQRVHPTMVPKDSAIAQVMGVTNAVTLDVEGFPPVTLVGPGAGGAATASAVVADIGDVARGHRLAPFGRATGQLTVAGKAPMQRHEGGYYIRLLAVDRPGTAATIATRLAEQQISLESIVQRHRGMPPAGGQDARAAGAPVPVILITYATTEDAVRRALAAVKADQVISGEPQLIRIEKNR